MRRITPLLATMTFVLIVAGGVALAATSTFSNTSAIQIPDSGGATPTPPR